ncbi:hypothetical protein SETIT_7G062500v2 [Setaria italica]|uniref:Uncharacterized protein n=1 Tax=Setaria italica TaxID=4555 RepID=A0A368RSG7_SETIT|nr:hypothetical protein SETIT_7G062500v2 [Setaria italica]
MEFTTKGWATFNHSITMGIPEGQKLKTEAIYVLGTLSLHKECNGDSSHPGGAARLSIAIGVYIMFYEYFCFHFLAM